MNCHPALHKLALRTGLRKGELPGLHWEDVDLNGGTATIHRSSSAPEPAASPT